MARRHMLCFTRERAADEHSRRRGAHVRFPRQEVSLGLELGCKKCMPDVAGESSYGDGAGFEAFLAMMAMR
jgi:hypothetical protein